MCSRRSRKRIPEVLAGIPGLILVYLFGSQVEGAVGSLSDYDVAILSMKPGT